MEDQHYSPKAPRNFIFAICGLLAISSLAVSAQDKAVSVNVIGLALVTIGSAEGHVSKENATNANTNMFVSLNKNNDGGIDMTEFGDWSVPTQTLVSAVAKRIKDTSEKEVFAAADANGDGLLSRHEVKALVEFDFSANDTDQDGQLNFDELGVLIPLVVRLVPPECPSLNTLYNGILAGGLCRGQ